MELRKILLSASIIVAAGAIVFGGTSAFFSDTETSTGNTFTAGAIDLQIDSEQHYNGMLCTAEANNGEYRWIPEDADPADFNSDEEYEAYNEANPAQYPQAGVECTGSWELEDLGDGEIEGRQFFLFDDVKPGDFGENTISIHVESNDAYMCAALANVGEADNTKTEPEADDDPDGDAVGEATGELDDVLTFFAWVDDGDEDGFQGEGDEGEGDNLFDPENEVGLGTATAAELVDQTWALAEGDNPISGGVTGYIGLAWCVGEFDPETGDCNGSDVNNASQTDSWFTDIAFYVEQARNNPDFTCDGVFDEDGEGERTSVGAVLTAYEAPEVGLCDVEVDQNGGNADLDTINEGIALAVEGNTVCVYDGVYQETVDVDKSLTLLSLDGPDQTTIVGGVIVDAPDVTVSGFEVIPGNTEGSTAGFYLKEPADNATISYNEIDASGVAGNPRGILNVIGTDLPGVVIDNNEIHGPGLSGSGIYTNPHTGLWTISNNDIDNFLAGIGQWNGANVLNNEFEHSTPGSEAIGVDSEWEVVGGVVNFNNFLNDTMLNTYGTIAGTIDAENNFFSDSGTNQVDDNGGTNNVDFDPEEGSAFPHS